MTKEPDDLRTEHGSAEAVFAAWAARVENGEALVFEELVGAHPAHAEELSKLHEDWKLFAPLLGKVVPGLIASSTGIKVAPLSGGDEDDPGMPSAELLDRLGIHAPNIGRYRFRSVLGRGGGGVVLKVWDTKLNRPLAMKVVLGRREERPSGHTPNVDSRTLTRFVDEARIASQLNHPGIVPVHELGADESGRAFFTMKLVKGEDLSRIFEHVKTGHDGWNQTRALGVVLKVCEAMSFAHSKGVIHRDLKPANVMVGRYGEVHVMDWGLARVLGEKDHRDLRIRPSEGISASAVDSLRDVEREGTPNSPLITMDGAVVGTPAYMSPEQARCELDAVGPLSDVYAIGAMLYELIARQTPFVPPGARISPHSILMRLIEGPPQPLEALAPRAPQELIAICQRAMARTRNNRYEHTQAFADDLRAYLEHRVVAAYETGAVAELKKWVVRNKALAAASAAAVLLLIGGLVVSSTLYAKADENARVAKQNEERAVLQERFATQRTNDVLSLSASQDLDDLVARADKLWPADPDRIGDYEQWLSDARELIDGHAADVVRGLKARPSLAQHQAKLAEIRAQALPQSDEERRLERESHPRYAELLTKQAESTWRSRMLGLEPWPGEAEVEADLAGKSPARDASALNALAWSLVDPEKPVYGSEVKALLLSRRAVAAATEAERGGIRHSLAWANFRLGRFDEALAEERRALDEVDASKQVEFEGYVTKIGKAIASWRGEELTRRRERRDALVAEVAAIERAVGERRTWEFTDPEAGWWQVQLSKLVSSLEALRDPVRGLMGDNVAEPYGWGVTKRYEFARTIRERSVDGREAKARWDDAIEAIVVSPKYGGLRLVPQLGLLPIGADPESGLWEFAHLQTGDPALRGADGKLLLTEETGLVFVLIPSGTFWMGAQKTDENGQNYDPQALANESPVHEVTLSAYLLSKYEMTQEQWLRIAARNPSNDGLSSTVNIYQQDLTNPVQQVTWTGSMALMERLGLLLPSEAQWEFGCRGGMATPWWTGAERESLRGKVNLADQTAKKDGASWSDINDWPDLEDGWVVHAPVGSLAANPYGLHEVHGNVWEWCRDGYANYSAAKQPDPVAPWSGASFHVIRGGSYSYAAHSARSARRLLSTPEYQDFYLGLRPARAITP